MLIFRREDLEKIIKGKKTATRRRHNRLKVGSLYLLRWRYDMNRDEAPGYVLITKCYKQRLAAMTEEDARKEGYNSLEEFKRRWIREYGCWDKKQEVIVYEFTYIPKAKNLKIIEK